MTKIVLIVLVAACMNDHPGVQQLASTDCYTCHKADYESTPTLAASDPAVPDHPGQNYPTTCAQCHNTTSWLSHPEALFAISTGSHAGIQCNGCHLDSTDNKGDYKGANTQCATCHFMSETVDTDDQDLATVHQTETDFSYSSPPTGYTGQNFCLECHPSGTSKHHDTTIWPETHHANKCSTCHNRAAGMDTAGANADCRQSGCHAVADLMKVGDHPSDVGTIASPSGCLQSHCHYGDQNH